MQTRRIAAALTAFAVAGLSVVGTAGTANAAQDQQRPHLTHGLGLNVAALRAAEARHAEVRHSAAQPVHARLGAAPGSYDLSPYALSPGDQGQVGSCVAWATGYSAIGLLMTEQNINGAPMAPM